jgi:predicted transcriptional regulator
VLAFAVGLDVVIWALVGLATSLLSKPATVSTVSRASELILPEGVTAEDLENLRKLLTKTGRPVNNNEVARLMSVTKGEASKRVSAAVAAGLVQRRRVGREVSIAVH